MVTDLSGSRTELGVEEWSGRSSRPVVASAGSTTASGDELPERTFSIVRLTLRPKAWLPHHAHTEYEETFFVLNGALEFLFGNKKLTIADGDFIRVRAGIRHGCVNQSKTPVELLIGLPPGEAERLWTKAHLPSIGMVALENVQLMSSASEQRCIVDNDPPNHHGKGFRRFFEGHFGGKEPNS